jgi:uncharacterized protein involved in response to NO
MAPVPRLRDYRGPVILSYGFRPFFLLGSAYAGLAILAWVAMFFGEFAVPTALPPRDWHIHEMLYGYLPAVVTGFLLTAIPNWTGRLPIQGMPLLGLVLAWLAGRAAVAASAVIGPGAAMAIDVSFLTLVGAACAREVFAGRNWRNLKVLLVIGTMILGNVVFHVEAILSGAADYGIRIGIAAAVFLIMLVGGRVIPSFTHNWLYRANPGRLPVPFGRLGAWSIATSGVALLVWILSPSARWTGGALLIGGIFQAFRLARWAGDRTLRNPLVLVLHVGYAFVPLGFLLGAAAAFGAVPGSAGIHAWTGGAVGIMTLAMMTRASLGHTGQVLAASWATQAIYAAAFVSVLARVCAALHPESSSILLPLAGAAWAAAFLGFSFAYGQALVGLPRRRLAATIPA